ncbi:hypothetical protein BDZ45DRAFT_691219 [Acephala macrosclerotiorum]|nr:hypothetical protein BDZ45DRAFT_691219 [Acephala macrosclerotiorum]
MATSIPLTFLRPMALPRPSTINYFLSAARLSTTTSASKPILSTPSGVAAIEPKVYTYRITRTPSNNYPIYTLSKRGGNMKLTKIRRIEGDANALRRDLVVALGLEEKEVVVNQLTRHVVVKGHKTKEIQQFLEERRL